MTTPLATAPEASTLAPQLDMPRVRRASRAEATWKRYQSAWRQFVPYCQQHGAQTLPADPSTVCAFLAHYAGLGRAWSSVTLCRDAIAKAHKVAGMADPTKYQDVADTLDAIARTIGTAPRRQAAPLTREQMQTILARLQPPDDQFAATTQAIQGDRLPMIRDRALLAVWWLSACRSDEMANLDLADVTWRPEGAVLHIRRSKTDQRGVGHEIPIPTGLATEALRAWIDTLAKYGITTGPVWRRLDGSAERLSPVAVAEVMLRRASQAGIEGLRGHSVRAGHVTQAAKDGTPLHVIAAQTGHKSLDTLLIYVRRANLFDETSAKGLL